MPRSRLIIVVVSFAAMIAVSVWVVLGAMGKHGTLPSLPLWAHGMAFAFVLCEAATRSIKIQVGAHAFGIPLTFWAAVRTSLGGDFASALTPARTGGEPARYLVLAETRMPTPDILVVLFLELVIEAATVLVAGLGLWLVLGGSGVMLGFLTTIVAGYAAFLFAILMFGLILAQRNASGPPPGWVRSLGLHAGNWRAIQRSLRNIRMSVTRFREANPRLLAASFFFSLIHIAFKLSVLPVIVWSIDSSASLVGLVMWPLVLMYGATVAPAPGGGGAIEFGFMKAFEGTLAPTVLATALIWWRFYTLYLYIFMGALAGGATVFRALRPEKAESAGDTASRGADRPAG
jgi:uncharacterized protein (TIRG00374 family)